MVQWITSHYFNDYQADWGVIANSPIIKPIKVAVPQGMDPDQIRNIIVTAGGITRPSSSNACPVGGMDFKPRSLTFVLETGTSVSVPVETNAGILAVASVGQTVFGNVVCIKLNGEEWRGLESIFNPTLNPVPGDYIAPGAGRVKTVYSQTMNYASDMGNSTPVPVKVNSDTDTNPPAALAAAWTACVGADVGGGGCRRINSRKHRRFIVDRLVNLPTGNLGRQSTEVPSSSRAAADIRACGTALASITSTFCLNYEGESYPSVQQFL